MNPLIGLSLGAASQFSRRSCRSLGAKHSICRNLRGHATHEAVTERTADAVVPDDVAILFHELDSVAAAGSCLGHGLLETLFPLDNGRSRSLQQL